MHKINLHGPWMLSAKLPPTTEDDASSTICRYPCVLPFSEDLQTAEFQLSRKFHAPTGIGPNDQLNLCFEFQVEPTSAMLNNQTVTINQGKKIQVDLTDDLGHYNEIVLVFPGMETRELPPSVFVASYLQISSLD